jgi:hypothetical protein
MRIRSKFIPWGNQRILCALDLNLWNNLCAAASSLYLSVWLESLVIAFLCDTEACVSVCALSQLTFINSGVRHSIPCTSFLSIYWTECAPAQSSRRRCILYSWCCSFFHKLRHTVVWLRFHYSCPRDVCAVCCLFVRCAVSTASCVCLRYYTWGRQ